MSNKEEKNKVFNPVPSKPDYPSIESEVLEFWKSDGTFMESIKFREASENEFVFYDGPPFANGTPHFGHILTGYVKDVIPRYKTMRGYRVPRRFGWDCHGLPAEMEMEKEAKIHGRQQISDYGIERFNKGCRSLAMKYIDVWEDIVTRQGRWVDFKNDYRTHAL